MLAGACGAPVKGAPRDARPRSTKAEWRSATGCTTRLWATAAATTSAANTIAPSAKAGTDPAAVTGVDAKSASGARADSTAMSVTRVRSVILGKRPWAMHQSLIEVRALQMSSERKRHRLQKASPRVRLFQVRLRCPQRSAVGEQPVDPAGEIE